MKTLFWICTFGIITGLLFRLPFAGGGILWTDIWAPLFSAIWLGKKIIYQEKFPKNYFIIPGLIFAGIAFFGLLLNISDIDLKGKILSGSYLVRFVSILIYGLAASELFINDEKNFWKGLFALSSFTVFLAFLQFYLFPDIGSLSTEGGFDPHIGRLLGTWMDPNYLGGFLAFMSPILIAKFYEEKDFKTKILFTILILAFLFAVFLTFSRSAYLATAIGVGLFLFFRDRKILFIGIIIVTIGIFSSERSLKRMTEFVGTMQSVIFQDTDEIDPTANLRLANWRKSLSLFEKNKIIGIGYNTYRFKAAEEGIIDENFFSAGGADSTYITVLVTTGILGFLVFLYFCGKIFLTNFIWYWQTKREIFLGVSSGFLAMLIHSFFVNSLFFPLIFLPVMAIAGIMQSIKTKQ